jgi:adenylate cyclase
LNPSNPTIIRYAALLSKTLGRLDEAITLNRRAIELDPLQGRTHHNLGLCTYYAGQLEIAKQAFQKSLELNPQRPVTHAELGRVYLSQSKPEEALSEMSKEPEAI